MFLLTLASSLLAFAGADEFLCARGTTCRVVTCTSSLSRAKQGKHLAQFAHVPRALVYKEEPQANMAYSHGKMKLEYDHLWSDGSRHAATTTFSFRGASVGAGKKQLVNEKIEDPSTRIERAVVEISPGVTGAKKWPAALYLLAPVPHGELVLQRVPLRCE